MNENAKLRAYEVLPPDFRDYIAGVRSHLGIIVLSTLAMLSLAAAWIIFVPPTYTSTSTLLVYNRGIQIFQQDIVSTSIPIEAAIVQNQIELLHSDKVLLSALSSLQPNLPKSGTANLALALFKFRKKLSIDRVGTSHAISVSFTSPNAEESAKAANAIVNAYLRDQIIINEEAGLATSAWLRNRTKELGANARVISEALPPPYKDGPGRIKVVVAATALGLGLGVMIALILTYLALTAPMRPASFSEISKKEGSA